MGWIISLAVVGVLVLAIIGLGFQTFAHGVYSGAQVIATNPTLHGALNQAKDFIVSQFSGLINPHS